MSSHKISTEAPMTFSAVYRVNPGAQGEMSSFVTEYVEAVRAASPSTLALSAGLNDAGTSLAISALHADTNAMEEHLVAIAPFIERSFQLAVVETITVVGSPGPRLSAALDANGSAGAHVTVVEWREGFVGAGAAAR